jgi:hypothetical protein
MAAQLPLPHAAWKFTESAEFLSLPAWTKAAYLVLERAVARLECRGRVEGALDRDDRWWTRVLGISRRSRRALETRGLIRVDGAALVLMHFDVEDEVKRVAWHERRRHWASLGGQARARRYVGEHDEEIREEIHQESLDLSPRNSSVDAVPISSALRQCHVEQISDQERDPLAPSQIPPPQPKPPHLSSPPTVHSLVVRRAERSAARTGRARSSPRGSSNDDHVDLKPPSAGAASNAGGAGPDFKMWFDEVHRLTGLPYCRQQAERLWHQLDMSVDERRSLWTFSVEKCRRRRRKPANAWALLRLWQRELRRRRAGPRDGTASTTAEIWGCLKG